MTKENSEYYFELLVDAVVITAFAVMGYVISFWLLFFEVPFVVLFIYNIYKRYKK